MTSVRPKAANGVSFGLTPVIAGRIRPTPPRNSQTPMKMNRSSGTAENQALHEVPWFSAVPLFTPSPPGQRQAPLSGSPAKRISEKKLEFHHFLLLCTFARVPAGAFL